MNFIEQEQEEQPLLETKVPDQVPNSLRCHYTHADVLQIIGDADNTEFVFRFKGIDNLHHWKLRVVRNKAVWCRIDPLYDNHFRIPMFVAQTERNVSELISRPLISAPAREE